jgi:tRNA nucleotidyltransferase/poly(A) polymerase
MTMWYTSSEKKILEFIRKTESHINEKTEFQNGNRVIVYFVGEWVIDKFLGRSNLTIDGCVQGITPVEFVDEMIEWCGFIERGRQTSNPSMGTKNQRISVERFIVDEEVGGEVFQGAGIKFLSWNVKMEFRGLRNYSVESPSRENLLNDAKQREFTTHAIYLQVRNLSLKDPTGCGLSDLKERVLRLPKDSTLLDDPIRVLGLMRLAGKYQTDGFVIDKDVLGAMMSFNVRVCHFIQGIDIRLL